MRAWSICAWSRVIARERLLDLGLDRTRVDVEQQVAGLSLPGRRITDALQELTVDARLDLHAVQRLDRADGVDFERHGLERCRSRRRRESDRRARLRLMRAGSIRQAAEEGREDAAARVECFILESPEQHIPVLDTSDRPARARSADAAVTARATGKSENGASEWYAIDIPRIVEISCRRVTAVDGGYCKDGAAHEASRTAQRRRGEPARTQ